MITEPLSDASLDGGVQAVTRYLVDALAARSDVDVHLVSFDYRANTTSRIEKRGYTQHLIPGSRLGTFTAYRAEQRRVDRYLQELKPDIVHSQGAGHFGIIALRCRFPSVMTIHGIMSEEAKHIANLRKKFRRWSVAIASDRLCIRRAKNTILISPYVGSYYGDRLSGRRFQIPNPVSQTFFNLRRDEDPGRILFAGRLYPLKGVSDLIEAIHPLSKEKDIRLILAGALRDERYVTKLKNRVAELGMDDIVRFCGVLDQTALLREFQRASVLVLPSYQESAPMVIQEAMAAGLPVIASNVGGIPDQIVDAKTGFLINPGDIESLSSRLRDTLNDQSLRSAFSTSAREIASNIYHADVVADKTIETYREVIKG